MKELLLEYSEKRWFSRRDLTKGKETRRIKKMQSIDFKKLREP